MDTVILLVYLAGCMVFLVPTAKFWLNALPLSGKPDSFEYAMTAVLGMATVLFWPLYIPGWWVVRVLKTDA